MEAEEEYVDGLLSGARREWNREGALVRDQQCAHGVLHGLCREWNDEGRLVAEQRYEFGVRVSGKQWDADGSEIEKFTLRGTDPGYEVLQAIRELFEDNTP